MAAGLGAGGHGRLGSFGMLNPTDTLMFDRRAASALALLTKKAVTANDQEKARAALEKAIERLGDDATREQLHEGLKRLVAYADEARRLPGSDYLESVRRLTAAGFARSSEVLFLAFLNSLKGLDFREVAIAAPTVKCIEAWVRTSGGAEAGRTLENQARADVAATYETAVCDWLLQTAGPEKCTAFLEGLMQRKPRPGFLPTWDQLLAGLLAADKKGQLLGLTLRLSSGNPERIDSLAVMLHSRPELFAAVVDSLPACFRRVDPPGLVEQVIRALFKDAQLADDLKRRRSCALLARLGAALILEFPDVEDAASPLKIVQELGLAMRASATSDDLQQNTWVFEHLGAKAEATTGGTHINRLGASHLAIAFSKASEGYAASDVLLMLAHNLGMIQVGEAEELLSFDPLRHEDLTGGLLPGCAVKVMESGWMLNGEVVVRAKVKTA